MQRKDLTGEKFDKLTVIKTYWKRDNSGKVRARCKCECECGNIIDVDASNIKRKTGHSCGCDKRDKIIKYCGRKIDGQRFGRLVVLETLWEYQPPKVKCKCDCGKEVILRKADVQAGTTQSCGCLQSERVSESNTKDWTGFVSDYGVKILKPYKQNDKQQWLWECLCPWCGDIFYTLPIRVVNGHMSSCGCKRYSSGELLICNILKNNNINFIREYSFPDCKGESDHRLRFDFGVFDENDNLLFLIEYDGKQHFQPVDYFGGEESFERLVKHDNIKNQYCNDNNIILLRFNYLDDNNIIEETILNIINTTLTTAGCA